jgi:hypothetical protein
MFARWARTDGPADDAPSCLGMVKTGVKSVVDEILTAARELMIDQEE